MDSRQDEELLPLDEISEDSWDEEDSIHPSISPRPIGSPHIPPNSVLPPNSSPPYLASNQLLHDLALERARRLGLQATSDAVPVGTAIDVLRRPLEFPVTSPIFANQSAAITDDSAPPWRIEEGAFQASSTNHTSFASMPDGSGTTSAHTVQALPRHPPNLRITASAPNRPSEDAGITSSYPHRAKYCSAIVILFDANSKDGVVYARAKIKKNDLPDLAPAAVLLPLLENPL
ncbi:hypothetical protein CALVIDRAFT_560276 [Calocera viscosa TUFC12733]|uniref:Uncharacterized protein n=1 Tax=Calocera viscosa (strain TUFC12733) TaxID=1330018 RepID=A0A167RJR5_CALVF|nr:hypothetical protein CALVIDRAFT_560276 [Calocera viscosa TUFC12733]